MTFEMIAMWVLGGLLAGLLAGLAMKRGGYGLRGDVLLGLVGSLMGGGILWTLGISPEAGMVAVAVAAFAGATILIVAQRKIWPTVV